MSDHDPPPVSRAEPPPPVSISNCLIQGAYNRILALGRRGPATAIPTATATSTSTSSSSTLPSVSDMAEVASFLDSVPVPPHPPETHQPAADRSQPDCGSKRKHLARSTSWASMVCSSSLPSLAPSTASVPTQAPAPPPVHPTLPAHPPSSSPTLAKKTCTKSRREFGLCRTLCPEPPPPPPLDRSLLRSAPTCSTPTPVPTRPLPASPSLPLASSASCSSQAAQSAASTPTTLSHATAPTLADTDVEMESAATTPTTATAPPASPDRPASHKSHAVWRALKSVIVNSDAQSSCPHQCSRNAPEQPSAPKVPVIVRCALDAQADLDLGASMDKLALGPSPSVPPGNPTAQPDLSPPAEPLIHSPFLRIEHFMIPNPALRQGESKDMAPPPSNTGESVTAFPTTPARGFVMLVYLFTGSMELIDSRRPIQPAFRSESLRCGLSGDEMPWPLHHTAVRRGNGLCLSMGRGLIYTLKAVFPPPTPMPTVQQPPLRNTDRGCPSMTLRQGLKAKLAALCPGDAAQAGSSDSSHRNSGGAPGSPRRTRSPSHTELEDSRFVSGLRIWLDVPRWAKFSEPCGLRFNRLDMLGAGRALPCSSPFAGAEPAPGRPDDAAPASKEGTCNATMHLLRPQPGVSEEAQGSGWEVKVVFDVGCNASYRVLGPSAAMHAALAQAPSPPPAFSLFDIALAPGGRYFCPIPPDRAACVYTLGPGLISVGDSRLARRKGTELPTYGKYVTLLLNPVAPATPSAAPCGRSGVDGAGSSTSTSNSTSTSTSANPAAGADAAISCGVWINHAAPPAGSGQDPKPVRLAVITARPTPPDQTVCWPSPRSTTVAASGRQNAAGPACAGCTRDGLATCTGTDRDAVTPEVELEPAAERERTHMKELELDEARAQGTCPLRAQYERMLAEEQFILTSATERAMTIQDWRCGRNGFENRAAFTV